jgi:hypothetical protein
MSTISAGTATGNALVSAGDTTGNLVLQTNGTTTALTLNTAQALGVGSSPSFGTSGQALLSAGSGAAPAWGNVQAPLVSGTNIKTINGSSVLGSGNLVVGGGSLIFLSEVVASAASTVTLETGFSSTYDNYIVLINDVFGTANFAELQARLRIAGTYATSGYLGKQIYGGSSATYPETANYQNSTSQAVVGSLSNSSTQVGAYSAELFNVNGSQTKFVEVFGGFYAPANYGCFSSRGNFLNTAAGIVSGIQFFSSSGTVTGTFRLYGIKKS